MGSMGRVRQVENRIGTALAPCNHQKYRRLSQDWNTLFQPINTREAAVAVELHSTHDPEAKQTHVSQSRHRCRVSYTVQVFLERFHSVRRKHLRGLLRGSAYRVKAGRAEEIGIVE